MTTARYSLFGSLAAYLLLVCFIACPMTAVNAAPFNLADFLGFGGGKQTGETCLQPAWAGPFPSYVGPCTNSGSANRVETNVSSEDNEAVATEGLFGWRY
ncbi:hypothetical protein THASP1DRAFT_33764 [Thamnocephalis sphaerospora]|uniref:Secreted protein n=1 Tax=Thamnocephalis sphaerospora TaxID=78915 RepID=A0A4P9XFV1_9FUNG|nr:hypothetical protein THASP1DRAFT_33764 [Thamnocephalis sphaerospora]|eukprot:RKP04467.1 hypothetical protein THASP1DRAFT_33764 [Thamnocephalis sphaerospora]